MPIKIAVCDDELQTIDQINTYLHQIEEEEGLRFQIFNFSTGEDLLQHMPRDIDILLLDITMAEISGIEAAHALRGEGADFYLFFITSNPQYALEGYSVHAYAFLCKPLQYAHLKTYILDVSNRLDRQKPDAIELKNGTTSTIINCSDLLYAEVYGHVCTAVLCNGERITFKTPLDKLEAQLKNRNFFRCHKSYLVNLNQVRSIRSSDIVMSDGTVIALSRIRKQEFLIAIQEVLGK